MADDMLFDLVHARELFRNEACDVLNVYPGKQGGLSRAQLMIELAAANNVACTIGSNLEWDVATAAMGHLIVACPTCRSIAIRGDSLGPAYHEFSIVRNPIRIEGPVVTVPDGPDSASRSIGTSSAPISARRPNAGRPPRLSIRDFIHRGNCTMLPVRRLSPTHRRNSVRRVVGRRRLVEGRHGPRRHHSGNFRLWLAGYGSKRPPDGKIHDLWMKALALEDAAGRKAVLITSDFQGVPKGFSDAVFAGLEQRLGLERTQVMITFSHNHCGRAWETTSSTTIRSKRSKSPSSTNTPGGWSIG